MEKSQLVAEVTALHLQRCGLLMGKSQDYATEDVLANFKRMNTLCVQLNINPVRSPADCALFLALLKFDRICNLKNKATEPKNESVKDSYCDLHNYLDLAYACECEKKSKEEKLSAPEAPKPPKDPAIELDTL